LIQPPFTEAHEAFRARAREFVLGELRPHADAWEEAGWFPNEVFGALAERGWLGLKYGGDWVADAVLAEELARCGSGGVAAGIGAHVHIATPPIFAFGTEAQRARWLEPAMRGERIGALAITEPDAGSDVAALRTRAERVDGGWLVSGAKTYITNGVRADFYVTAVRTGGEGHGGVSLMVLERNEAITVRAEQARLAGVRHGGAGVRRGVRPERPPARRREPRLLPDHGQLPVGAARDGARGCRRDAADARARGRRAGWARAGDPPPHRRARHARRGGHRDDLSRAAPPPRRRGRRPRGDDGQARHPADELRAPGRVPAPDRPRPGARARGPRRPLGPIGGGTDEIMREILGRSLTS
jgi:alkylation response protein AidB-like acyl-CoA dehydrogenase